MFLLWSVVMIGECGCEFILVPLKTAGHFPNGLRHHSSHELRAYVVLDVSFFLIVTSYFFFNFWFARRTVVVRKPIGRQFVF